MARKKLNMTPEERRLYNNEMHRKQTAIRKEKAQRQAYKEWVKTIIDIFEKLGWSKTELMLGADDEMLDSVVDELMKDTRFKVMLGETPKFRINKT